MAAVGAMTIALSLGGTGVAAVITPAQQLLSSMFVTARAQSSVHYVVTYAGHGRIIRTIGDAGVERGIQRITFREGTRVGHVTVLVASNTAYVRGDAFALENFMGLTGTRAPALADKWILLQHTAPGFAAVAAGVRLGSTIDAVNMPGLLRIVGVSTVRGQRVIGVQTHLRHGALTATETLYVRSARPNLPVEQITTSDSPPVRVQVVFSSWNEPVHVTAPSLAVSLK